MDGVDHIYQRSLSDSVYYCSSDRDCPSNLVCYSCSLSWISDCNSSSSSICLCSSYYGHISTAAAIASSYPVCTDYSNGHLFLFIAMLTTALALLRLFRILADLIKLKMNAKLKMNSLTISLICAWFSLAFIVIWQQIDASIIYNPLSLSLFVEGSQHKQSVYYGLLRGSVILTFGFFSPACLGLSVSWIWIVQKVKHFKTIRRQMSNKSIGNSRKRNGGKGGGHRLTRELSQGLFSSGLSESGKRMLRRYLLFIFLISLLQVISLIAFGILDQWMYMVISCIPFKIIVIISYIVGGKLLCDMLIFTERVRSESSMQQSMTTSNRSSSRKDLNRNGLHLIEDSGKVLSSPQSSNSFIKVLHTSKTYEPNEFESGRRTPGSQHSNSEASEEIRGSSSRLIEKKLSFSQTVTINSTTSLANHGENEKGEESPMKYHKLDASDDLITQEAVMPDTLPSFRSNPSDISTSAVSPKKSRSGNLVAWVTYVTKGVSLSVALLIIIMLASVSFIVINSDEYTPPTVVSPLSLMIRLIPLTAVITLSFIESFYHHCIVLPALEGNNTTSAVQLTDHKSKGVNNIINNNKPSPKSCESSGDGIHRYRSRSKSKDFYNYRQSENSLSRFNESHQSMQEDMGMHHQHNRKTSLSTPVSQMKNRKNSSNFGLNTPRLTSDSVDDVQDFNLSNINNNNNNGSSSNNDNGNTLEKTKIMKGVELITNPKGDDFDENHITVDEIKTIQVA